MTKKDVIELRGILDTLKDLGNTKFKYSVLKNLDLLKHEMSALAELENQANQTIVEFTNDRNALILELGKQDDKGNTFVDTKDEEVAKIFTAKLAVLLDKHKDAVNIYNTKITELNEILKENIDSEFNFRKLSIEQVPEDGVSGEQLNKLIEFGIITD